MNNLVFIGANDMDNPKGEIIQYTKSYKNGLFIEATDTAYKRLITTLNNTNEKYNTNYIPIHSLITSEQDKEYTFYIFEQFHATLGKSEVSSSIYQKGKDHLWPSVKQTNKTIQLVSNRMDNILKKYKWDNKKYDCIIDTQGAELEVLKSFGNYIYNIKNLTVEASSIEIYKGGVQFEELDNYLKKIGFKRITEPPSGNSYKAHIDVKYSL